VARSLRQGCVHQRRPRAPAFRVRRRSQAEAGPPQRRATAKPCLDADVHAEALGATAD
jgi:hypothetical protein